MIPIILALSLIVPLVPSDPSTDWHQWRGPNRDGAVVSSRLPKKWPEKFPAPKWTAKIGIGYSSPVISEGRVFVMSQEKVGEESCLCYDANTGKRLWEVKYPCTFEPPDPTAGKGPNSTPTVDKDRVYMLGLGGMFHCLDVKTGKVLWKHNLQKECWGVEKNEKLGDDAWFPPCGATASALVDGKQIILPVGGKKVGAVAAFDRETGKVMWHELPERSSYASPLLVDLAGRRQYVAFTGLRMTGLDAVSHKLLWEFPFKAMFEQTICTPVVWKDHVIVSGEGRPTTCLKITYADGKLKQEEAWKSAELRTYLVTPIVVKDHLIGWDQGTKKIVCLDLNTGKASWTSTSRMGKMIITLVNAGDQILALTDSGDMFAIDPNPTTFTEKGHWKVSEAGNIWSYPAISGSRIYIKDKENLICYDVGAG